MWKELDTVVYYTDRNFKYGESVAIFRLHNTIINLYSDTLKYCKKSIPIKLKEIHNKGSSIILYDSFYTIDLNHTKNIVQLLIDDLEIPILIFFSTKCNRYRPPCTHLWTLIKLYYTKKNKKLDISKSILIGNNAGRMKISKGYKPYAIDKSCSDRSFATNIGIMFLTPEKFFCGGSDIVIWSYDNKIATKDMREKALSVSENTPIITDELKSITSDIFTLIITGVFSCGKSTLSKKTYNKLTSKISHTKLTIISENDYDDFTNMLNDISESYKQKKSVIIDIICDFKKIISIVKNSMFNKIPILIIEIKTIKEIAILLDFIRTQTSKDSNKVLLDKSLIDAYYNKYEEPNFNDIPCIKYISFPLQLEISDALWYEYSY